MSAVIKASRFVCAWCDVYCRVERVQHDEAGREIIRDSVCAYCGRTELRFALGRQTPIPKLSVRPDGLPLLTFAPSTRPQRRPEPPLTTCASTSSMRAPTAPQSTPSAAVRR
jgi:hypothetical protein